MTYETPGDRMAELLVRADTEIAAAHDIGDLYARICDLAVGIGGYCMAWIGLAENDQNQTVRAMAHSGFDSDYIETINISWSSAPNGQGPTGSAIRTGTTQIVNAIETDPRMRPWRELALGHGYHSCISLPLRDAAGTFGVLVILARETGRFDATALEGLGALADKVSIAVGRLRFASYQRLG
jgi:GAF domain-containing protein